MVDYSYVELTSTCIRSLYKFQKEIDPNHRTAEISRAIKRGVEFIKSKQRKDGSWYGSWAVCFTYGGWFAIEALTLVGTPADRPWIERGCKFFVSKQRPDGGWGEDFDVRILLFFIWKNSPIFFFFSSFSLVGIMNGLKIRNPKLFTLLGV